MRARLIAVVACLASMALPQTSARYNELKRVVDRNTGFAHATRGMNMLTLYAVRGPRLRDGRYPAGGNVRGLCSAPASRSSSWASSSGILMTFGIGSCDRYLNSDLNTVAVKHSHAHGCTTPE